MATIPPDRHTILVIEDDHDTLEFLELFLDMSGYVVQSAATSERGLELAVAHPIEAVLLDRRLPDGDGVAVCRRLREQLGPDTPIVLLTADHDPALEAVARGAGATAFVRKPFAPDALLQQLAAVGVAGSAR